MAAGVVKGAQRTVAVAYHHHRIAAHLESEIVAGILHFAVVSDEQPIAVPDQLEIDLIFLLLAVKILMQGSGGLALAQPGQYRVAGAHCMFLIGLPGSTIAAFCDRAWSESDAYFARSVSPRFPPRREMPPS